MIKAKNIFKRFEKNAFIEDLSFEINTGDKVCFIADSGKGKSTLLKILLGLETLDKGRIYFKNQELNTENIQNLREELSWLPQDFSISIENGEELIELLENDTNEVIRFLKKLNLEANLIKQNFNSLSGGQKQKLLIANCLALKKSILILDEPTSALDENSIDLLIKTLDEIENLTVLSASHNSKWKNYCNKIISL